MLSTMYSLLVFFLTLATFATAFPLNLFGHGTFAHEKRQTVTKYMFVLYVIPRHDQQSLLIEIQSGNSYTKVGFDFSKAAPSAANPIGNPSFPSTSTTCGTGNLNWVEHLSTTYNNSLMLTYDLAAGGALVNKTLIDPVVSTTDLVGQVSLWNSNAEKHQKTGAWTKDNTLFAIWLGVNDVYRGYNTTSDLDTLYQTDLNQLFTQAIHLYNNGAKNFIFLSVPRKIHHRTSIYLVHC